MRAPKVFCTDTAYDVNIFKFQRKLPQVAPRPPPSGAYSAYTCMQFVSTTYFHQGYRVRHSGYDQNVISQQSLSHALRRCSLYLLQLQDVTLDVRVFSRLRLILGTSRNSSYQHRLCYQWIKFQSIATKLSCKKQLTCTSLAHSDPETASCLSQAAKHNVGSSTQTLKITRALMGSAIVYRSYMTVTLLSTTTFNVLCSCL